MAINLYQNLHSNNNQALILTMDTIDKLSSWRRWGCNYIYIMVLFLSTIFFMISLCPWILLYRLNPYQDIMMWVVIILLTCYAQMLLVKFKYANIWMHLESLKHLFKGRCVNINKHALVYAWQIFILILFGPFVVVSILWHVICILRYDRI